MFFFFFFFNFDDLKMNKNCFILKTCHSGYYRCDFIRDWNLAGHRSSTYIREETNHFVSIQYQICQWHSFSSFTLFTLQLSRIITFDIQNFLVIKNFSPIDEKYCGNIPPKILFFYWKIAWFKTNVKCVFLVTFIFLSYVRKFDCLSFTYTWSRSTRLFLIFW